MALLNKVLLARIFITATLASIVVTGVVFINPINLYSYFTKGICKIDSISWTEQWCEASDGSLEDYYVPVITASFRDVTYFDYKVRSYTGLYINKDYYNSYQATIFDDGTGDALVQCEWPGIQAEINKQLVNQIPELTDYTGFNSFNATVDRNFTYMEWFPCFHRLYENNRLFLNLEKPNYYLSAFFVLAIVLYFVASVIISKVDDPGCIFAQIGNFGVMVLFAIHMGFFTIFVYIPAKALGKENLVIKAGKLFEKGSIFLPLFWLFKKCRKSCTSESPPPSPNLSRRRSVPAANNVTVELATPRRIQRRVFIEATASIQSLATQPDLSDATAVSVGLGPPQYGNLVIENSGTDGDGLPPPPSYGEVVYNGDSSRV